MASQPLILEIQTGKHKGRRIRLTEAEMTIGRGETSSIRIASAEVSRDHCRLILENGRVRVVDLNSRNGTFVDGRPVDREKPLNPGGLLTVGPLTFLLVGKEEVAPLRLPGVRLKGKTGSDDDLSDDDIAAWLSDMELPTVRANEHTDTSILKRPNLESPTTDAAPQVPELEETSLSLNAFGLPNVVSRPDRRRQFKSIAEEAQDIIQRHLESLSSQETEG